MFAMVQFVSALRTHLLLSFLFECISAIRVPFVVLCARKKPPFFPFQNSVSLCAQILKWVQTSPDFIAVQYSFVVLLSVLFINFTLLCARGARCVHLKEAIGHKYLSERWPQPVVERKQRDRKKKSRFFLLLVDIKIFNCFVPLKMHFEQQKLIFACNRIRFDLYK